jgi:mannosyltransferase OCH1-like enzyme
LETWKKHLPDYEVMLWDTKLFDLNTSVWVRQAFEKKKYAFAADYIRFYALYHHGGIYMDSDVEVLKCYDDLLDLPYFMGAEKAQTPEAAIMGAEKGCDWIKVCLDYYQDRPFINEDGSLNIQTVPDIMIRQIEQIKPIRVLSLEDSLNIRKLDMQKEVLEFNDAFFSPKVFDSREVEITPYTYAIHHYQNSWFSPKAKAYYRGRALLVKLFGRELVRKIEVTLIPWKFKK